MAPQNPNKQRGYSLVEMLLVLSIIMIVSSVTFFQLNSLGSQKKIDYFFEQFRDDMFFAQIHAMGHGQSVKIYFNDKDASYKIVMVSTGAILVKRDLLPMFELNTLPVKGNVSYLGNGGISKSGTIWVSYKDRLFTITFLLGEGRFYVKEV